VTVAGAGSEQTERSDLPAQVAALMRGFAPPWFIAGGWAIDLYLGRATRPHADIEIAILRRDQLALQDHLRDWRLEKVVDGKFSPWPRGECLELPVFELQCTNEHAAPRTLEVLLNETRGDVWVFRRNANITRPLAAVYLTTHTGINFLSPEIVLLYKSKEPRAKDEQDFAAVVARLETERRTWLRNAIAACAAGHHWLNRL
jgi:Aminoglycoside-2''-adenylyltransferase